MADSTSNLDTLSSGVAQKEVKANSLWNAGSRAQDFGRRDSTTIGLIWGSYGTPRWYINATATAKANFTQSITASATRFLQINRSLTQSEVATAFSADHYGLYRIVTGSSTISSWEDHRDPHHLVRFLYGRFTKAMADANQTLTYAEAMCESMELTGSLSALRDVIVPTIARSYIVFANTSGGFGVRVKTSAGTGITVADGKRAILECDGTNVVRVTADV